MTLATFSTAIERIKAAPEDSPIAVFQPDKPAPRRFDVMFARTVASQRRIRADDKRLVGVFDKTSPMKRVKQRLMTAIDREAQL